MSDTGAVQSNRMKWVLVKNEGKMLFKSKLKLVALAGLVLSLLSLFTHFLLAKHTYGIVYEYHSSVTIMSWMPKFKKSDLSVTNVMCLIKPLQDLIFNLFLRFKSLF